MNEIASTLAMQQDDIARRAVELTAETSPSSAAGPDEEDDTKLLVRALVGSVVADDPHIFGDYTGWAAELLAHRGPGAPGPALLLGAIRRAIAELAPSTSAAAEPHLKAGEDALAG